MLKNSIIMSNWGKVGEEIKKTIDISNKFSVKDYGKPNFIFSSLLLFYREKLKSENEKSNVIQTLSNGQEKNTKNLKIRKEENIREESGNGFREYKM